MGKARRTRLALAPRGRRRCAGDGAGLHHNIGQGQRAASGNFSRKDLGAQFGAGAGNGLLEAGALFGPERGAAALTQRRGRANQPRGANRLSGIERNRREAGDRNRQVPGVATFPEEPQPFQIVLHRRRLVAVVVADDAQVAELVAEPLLVAQLAMERQPFVDHGAAALHVADDDQQIADVAQHVGEPGAIPGLAHALQRHFAERMGRCVVTLFLGVEKENVASKALVERQIVLAGKVQRPLSIALGPIEVST